MRRLRLSGLAIAVIVALMPGLHAETDEKASGKGSEPAAEEETKEVFRAPLASATEPASVFRFSGNAQIDFGLALLFALYTAKGTSSTWQVGVQPGIMSRFDVNGRQWLLKSAEFWIGLPVAYRMASGRHGSSSITCRRTVEVTTRGSIPRQASFTVARRFKPWWPTTVPATCGSTWGPRSLSTQSRT